MSNSIKIAGATISKVMLGSTPIKKVMCGGVDLLGGTEEPVTPEPEPEPSPEPSDE